MKNRIIAALLALLMALFVSGCAENLPPIEIPPLPEVTPTPVPTFVTEEPVTDPTDTPLPGAERGSQQTQEDLPVSYYVINSTTVLLENDPNQKDEEEELILTFSYDSPRIDTESAFADAAAKINETLATVEETFYTGNSYGESGEFIGYSAMLEAAEDNYNYVKENPDSGLPLEYSDTLTARVTRATDTVFSIVYTENVYMGGPHGTYHSKALNFDMATGDLLTLEDLSTDPEAFSSALLQIMKDMIELDEDSYYSERIAEDFLPDGTDAALQGLLREGSWYFDHDGLVIFSGLEEFGPYAAGILEFHIPYEKLVGLMDAKWLLPADRLGEGIVSALPLERLEGGEYDIVSKLVISAAGEQICILVDGRIYDVSISSVYYLDRFYENNQIWYASTLNDCAVQLQVTVPEGLPDLLITYYLGDGSRHGKLLSQSGLDGSYILVDDDVEAVG